MVPFLFDGNEFSFLVMLSIGVSLWLSVFFNLRFGWGLASFMVPGFLAAIFMMSPMAACVMLIQAWLSFSLVRIIFYGLPKLHLENDVFSKERLFALILSSLFIQLLWHRYILGNGWQDQLSIFSTVVVSLIANQLWQPGYRMVYPLGVITSLTYLFIPYGLLMKDTFYTLSNPYDYGRASFAYSPQHILIFLLTAFIASRFSYRRDWESILVPAILALYGYTPYKIAIPCVEGILVFLLSLPFFKCSYFSPSLMTEGKKLLLYFNIGFFYKVLIGYTFYHCLPRESIVDGYGFGYLLSVLIALHCYDAYSA